MAPEDQFDSDLSLSRYEALLQMADLMVHHQDVGELFRKLPERLKRVAPFQFTHLALHDPAKNVMVLQILEDLSLPPIETPIEDTPSGWVWKSQELLIVPDVQSDSRFQSGTRYIPPDFRSGCLLPLTTRQRRLGALALGNPNVTTYSDVDLHLLQQVADLVALAVENALTHSALQQEKERLQMLLEVNAALVANREVHKIFSAISEFMRPVFKQHYASVTLYDKVTQSLRLYALDSLFEQEQPAENHIFCAKECLPGRAFLANEAAIYLHEELLTASSSHLQHLLRHGIRSLMCTPLIGPKGAHGTLNLGSCLDQAFFLQDITLLKQIATPLAVALENAQAYRELSQLKDKLAEEKQYLQGEIRSEVNFEEIIGESPSLKHALEDAKTVAPSDATALILGETGTGKELVARAIHRMSGRKDASFIKLNCAAIPTGLLESELFGHEKGAFTGATSQKIGRLELADKGTLFLDEVGDIPLEIQPKLLRVLQDREFERLGGTRTIRVNVRLVAATNRDLVARVAERAFRSDLFYRLNVFPIRLPALRERRNDIPLLVRYFVQKFARRMNKQIESLSTETMQALESWDWPGNIRELENFIERSVILTDGVVLRAPLAELHDHSHPAREGTLLSMEREHIVRALRESDGVVAGLQGAAARLGVKRTTLQSMIARFAIVREEYKD